MKLKKFGIANFKSFDSDGVSISIDKKINEDVLKVIDTRNSVISKKSYGGTSFGNIKKVIKKYKKEIND